MWRNLCRLGCCLLSLSITLTFAMSSVRSSFVMNVPLTRNNSRLDMYCHQRSQMTKALSLLHQRELSYIYVIRIPSDTCFSELVLDWEFDELAGQRGGNSRQQKNYAGSARTCTFPMVESTYGTCGRCSSLPALRARCTRVTREAGDMAKLAKGRGRWGSVRPPAFT